MMQRRKKWRGLLGTVLLLISLFFATAALGDLVGGTSSTATGTLWGILAFFLGTGIVGGGLVSTYLRSRHQRPSQGELEGMILTLARMLGGRVTAAEVSSRYEVSIPVAKQALNRLCGLGVATAFLTEAGVMVYQVDFLPPSADGPAIG